MKRVAAGLTARVRRFVWPDARPESERVVCHEWFAVLGGSDKVAAELVRITDADVVYTFALADDCLDALDIDRPVVTWRYGRWAGRSRRFVALLPIMPLVWRALDVAGAELTVTSSHACVNAVRGGGRRVSYCHTPMRYAWEWRLEVGRLPSWARPLLPPVAAVFRRLDRGWSSHVHTYVANSNTVADRIRRAYGRESIVVPPPIDVERFAPTEPGVEAAEVGGPFVTAGRFVAYKRFDLAIEAANIAGMDLVVAGDGPELDRLVALAGPTVRLVVAPTDDQLRDLLGRARAFVFPGVEDFGMLPVEAQACGTPVIARRAGGALDSVVDGVTGCFVDTDDPRDWARALTEFDPGRFVADEIRSHAESFSTERFRHRVADVLG
jgi:glycosyltransferase involved in cell wall biosynthesis